MDNIWRNNIKLVFHNRFNIKMINFINEPNLYKLYLKIGLN